MKSYVDSLDEETVRELVAHTDRVCITIGVPTSSTGANPDVQIALRNAVKEVRRRLRDIPGGDDGLEQPLAEIERLGSDSIFMSHLAQGLVFCVSPSLFRWFRVGHPVAPFVCVNSAFRITPLLASLRDGREFYVLTLSQKTSELYIGNAHRLSSLLVNALPTMQESLFYLQAERQLQFHSGGGGTPQRRRALFFGHGSSSPAGEKKDYVSEYFRNLDALVAEILRGRTEPLVIAAVDPLIALYRECNTYPNLVTEAVTGNFEAAEPHELHQRAFRVVSPYFDVERRRATERVRESGRRDLVASSLEEILPAAQAGAVDTLLVSSRQPVWGHFDPLTNDIRYGSGDEYESVDLVDYAAAMTIASRGSVHFVEPSELGDGTEAVALLRYPVPAATFERRGRFESKSAGR